MPGSWGDQGEGADRPCPPPAPQQVAPGVHVLTLGRGAAASNVYLVGSDAAWTLVDAGWASSAEAIRTDAKSVFGPGAHPAAILLTHIHPDHSGSAGPLARSWQVPVYVGADELAAAAGRYLPQYSMPLDRWLVVPVMGRSQPGPAQGSRPRIASPTWSIRWIRRGTCRACRAGRGSRRPATSPTCVEVMGS